MIRLIAIDQDGTCLNSKSKISDRTLKTLRSLSIKGIMVVPTTGRAFDCIPNRLKKEKFYDYVITSNGAKVIDLANDKMLYGSFISKDTALRLVKACDSLGVGVTAHVHDHYLIQGRLLMALGHLAYGDDVEASLGQRSAYESIRYYDEDVEELQFYFLSLLARRKVEKIVQSFPEVSAAYDKFYVEVFSRDTSKGTALKKLADHLGLKKEEIACVGDGENDLSMFDVSGLTFAMGNAVNILKEKADIILPSNDEEGISFIEKYI